jgi:hypothetical protein
MHVSFAEAAFVIGFTDPEVTHALVAWLRLGSGGTGTCE